MKIVNVKKENDPDGSCNPLGLTEILLVVDVDRVGTTNYPLSELCKLFLW